ncbi:MAG: lamin tail domain-containing protein [Chloroflexota bacterium]
MKRYFYFFILVVLVAVGCDNSTEIDGGETAVSPTEEPTPVTGVVEEPVEEAAVVEETAVSENPEPEPESVSETREGIFISEMLQGIAGNNNHEFVELYNAGEEPVDLNGWSLWYQLKADENPVPLYRWEVSTWVPGLGHYLLAQADADLGILPDATFEVGLFAKGGLILRDADNQDVDVFGWGDAPDGSFTGTPAAQPEAGQSLERLPGGEAGNWQATSENGADFVLLDEPNPQNSGSELTPLPDNRLNVTTTAPETLVPGSEFMIEVGVSNEGETAVSNITLSLPVADHFELIGAADGDLADGRLSWGIGELGVGETAVRAITLQAPLTYADTLLGGTFASGEGIITSFAAPRFLAMSGGSIPIATVRGLPEGSVVSVEGVATMYTGGYFAGSTSTKFYVQDETGGVQVFAPGGMQDIRVRIGDRIRVTGELEYFRNQLEVIPLDNLADVEILSRDEPVPEPTMMTAADHEAEDLALGRLNVVEGTATRVEEFTFSYEVDLLHEDGTTTLVYVDKLTNATTETLDVGKQYRIVGVTEMNNDDRQLKPRMQTDLSEIFPPVLLLSQTTSASAQVGDELVYGITAVNHTPDPLTNLEIKAVLPQGATVTSIDNEGMQDGDTITWLIGELLGGGTEAIVGYTATINSGVNTVVAPDVTAVAAQWPDPATAPAFTTFIGDGVPIWALQGDGAQSAYRNTEVATVGIVTAVFPDLGGFWLQDTAGDGSTATSDGLFVLTGGDFTIPVVEGDEVQVMGRVREVSGQTLVDPATANDIVVLSSDNGLPSFVTYDPPQDVAKALVYNESLEGMLVAVEETAVAVAPTTRFGEYSVVLEKWDVDQVARTDEVGYLIYVDDGSTVSHDNQGSLPYAIASGDRVTGLFGPLAFTFGNYKIEPLLPPQIEVAERPLPTLPPLADDQFSVATFNVENLFDTQDPHPSSPPKPLRSEYNRKLTKVAEAIVAMGAPTIIGLQEVENIGVLETLVSHELLAELGYQPFLIEGEDSRGIDVAYIARSDRANVFISDSFLAPDGLLSRPTHLIQVELLPTGKMVYLLNSHFTSLAAGEEATEPRRTAQAAWNIEVMEMVLADDPDAEFIVLGDLNSFYDTLPLHTLQDFGLRHVYEFSDDEALPYTYIFEGRTQTLDHILVSEGLFADLTAVHALHLNADYPIAASSDATAQRTSDHDPLIAVFMLR